CQYLGLYRLCKRYLIEDQQILDWGAGNGHCSYYLLDRGYKVTGYSFEAYSYEHLLGEFEYEFIQGNSSSPILLPFDNDYFDAVISVGVLEHVQETGGDDVGSLREIKRILKPRGHFICYHLPNKFSWIDSFIRLSKSSLPHHEYRYTADEIRRMCKIVGLELREINQYASLPRQVIGRNLPQKLRYSIEVAEVYNSVDSLLEKLIKSYTQNYSFVLQKRYAE
ncbi:MAG: class I SAM-dependent methyltransferase, partial [Anaerolineales bacterium]